MNKYFFYCFVFVITFTVCSHAQHVLSGTVLCEFGTFENAIRISGNVLGDVYVLDASTVVLHKFWNEGKEHKSIGGKGWGATEFDEPKDVCAIFPLHVYVADANNRRVQKFDNQCNYIQSIDEETIAKVGGRLFPAATALSALGELFILDEDAKRIIKCNTQSVVEKEISLFTLGKGSIQHPKDIAALSNGSIAVLDEKKIVFMDAFGNYQTTLSFDSTLRYQTISARENILIAVAPQCITFFSSNGEQREDLHVASLFGFPVGSEIRDAVMIGSRLYILLSNKVIVIELNHEIPKSK